MDPKTGPAYLLEVVGGGDARLHVGHTVRTIGRAKDADLVLGDPAVSRHHVQALATEGGVELVVCGTATRFLIDGRPFKRAHARIGQTVVIGKTSLRVHAGAPSEPAPATEERTDVTGLLTGAHGDARGLADVYALIESLDEADDEEALLGLLEVWASANDVASRAELLPEDPAGTRRKEILERQEGESLAVVTVPVACEPPARLRFAVPARHLTDSKRRVLVVVGRIFGSALERVRRLKTAAQEKDSLRSLHFGSARAFLGTSPAAEHLAGLVPRLAASDVTVLIEGETGVGKTFFARLLHEGGRRAREPLRVINCASIPETLIESELFGHERGAFTGAAAARVGALEAAGAGTLFLDEIGELSLASQAKLLRAMEEKRFERLGSNRTLELRARVLCATNRDLAAMAADGRFRSDLLFRVSVVKLTIPPLRERGDDLILLATQVLKDAAREAPRRIDGFSKDALDAIGRYSWPGNVRELRNAIEHAVVMGDGPVIERSDLPEALAQAPQDDAPPSDGRPVERVTLPANLSWLEARAIEAALRVAHNNRTRAAALLGIPRSTLYNKLGAMPQAPGSDED